MFILIALFAFADRDVKKKGASEVTPKTKLSDDRSFNVLGLNDCVGEFDNKDGIEVFTELESAVLKLIPLREDLNESYVLDFN
ncbi:MAG: hypothetical protein ACI9AU_000685 [Bacteroidia bacterium]